MIARIGLGVAFVIALAGIGLGAVRVAGLEAIEVNAGHATTLREAAHGREAVLASTRLYPGTRAVFELCASDPMEAARWADTVELQVRLDGEAGVQVPLTADALARARRNETSACFEVGAGPVLAEGDYSIAATFEALPEAIADVPLRARIAARPTLGDFDLTLVVVTWLGSFLLVVFLAVRAAVGSVAAVAPTKNEWEEAQAEIEDELEPKRERKPWPGWLTVPLGVILMLVAFFGIGLVASGAAAGLLAGVGLGIYEATLGVLLVGGATVAVRLDTCALARPAKWWWLWFPGAGIAGIALMFAAQLSTRLVPSTGRSSVEAFVSWPSGMLSFAALAVAAPLCEEVFFRGFVYGALKRYGVPLAFLAAWLLFVAFHGAQTWGQWGALVGIGVTGLGLTTIRAVSGSALVAATAHLVYNGLLAVQAFL
ncbi:MAG: CPBP family intramembrane metalloprotease [Sandaracinaceae bacterium]|nr:CPBP family intramembrane metalloprotease [Sandaracinaceae bacterium]